MENNQRYSPTTTTHTYDIANKAQEFNEFFSNVGKTTYEETQALLGSENLMASVPNAVFAKTPFHPQPVDTSTVVLTIKQLQNTQSFGSDNDVCLCNLISEPILQMFTYM